MRSGKEACRKQPKQEAKQAQRKLSLLLLAFSGSSFQFLWGWTISCLQVPRDAPPPPLFPFKVVQGVLFFAIS